MKAKILVVDDEVDLESLIRQKFRKQIRNDELEFCFAHNGKEALIKVLEESDIDMVLSDINMPIMDGLTLLSKLKEEAPLIKSVIVSAYGDLTNIRTAMNRGAFDFVTKPIDFSDLGITINKTLEHVRQIKENITAIKENNILKMYVDDSVLTYMSGMNMEEYFHTNETIDATVAFVDLNKFTAISEHSKPDFVVELLNDYFDIMVRQIIAFGGYVDKFIGDAIMAVFRGDNHLQNAIKASLEVRREIGNLPEVEADFKFIPRVSVGINSGEMVSGNIGSKSLRRFDYTVIGDTVNTAARLQSAAGENRILITEDCYNQIKDHFKCKLIGPIKLKNKLEPIIAYEVEQTLPLI
jgi:class 3 adenylate cyclase/AmiR/NasT family two-component response regulator